MFDQNNHVTQIVSRADIEQKLKDVSPKDLIAAIEISFTAYSNKTAVVPPVGTLTFEQPPGDVHIKYGYIKNQSRYVIKIASGFYENPELGLSSSNGLNLVFDQKTGQLNTVLLDEGLLTDVRTALAGAVAAKHLAPSDINCIGIVGTGIQARLQLQYLQYVTDCKQVKVWGRNSDAVQQYKEDMTEQGFEVEVAQHTSEMSDCQLIVTTTPSTDPLLDIVDGETDQLITAMGADTKGKQELSSETLRKARLIALDSESQCKSHGEIHKSWNRNQLDSEKLREIGSILSDATFARPKGLIVADLTGIATQDIMISSLVLS